MSLLVPPPKLGDWPSAIRAIKGLSNKLGYTANPTFAGMKFTGLTANRLMVTNGSKVVTSLADLSSYISGTANRVTVSSDGDGTVTLTGPQDIHTGASPTFANLYVPDDGKIGNADNHFQFHDDVNFITTSVGTWLGLGTDTPRGIQEIMQSSGGSNTPGQRQIQVLSVSSSQAFGYRFDASSNVLMMDRLFGGVWQDPVIAYDRRNGNVGINISLPGEKLDVNGNILVANGGTLGTPTTHGAITIATNGEVTLSAVVTGVTPTAENHLATKGYIDLALGAFKTFFLSDTGSGVGSLNLAYPHETEEAGSTITPAAMGLGDAQLVQGYITEAGEPATTTIHAGIIIFHFHAKKGASNHRTTVLYCVLSWVDANGTSNKTTIATSEISGELADTEADFDIHATVSADVEIASTARLILDVYANVGAGALDSAITLYMEGHDDSYFSTKVDSGIWQNHYDVLDDLGAVGQVASDGQMLVGTGAGAFAYESGNTLRTTIGVDAAGTAAAAVGSHESSFNHSNYNDAYSHISADGSSHSIVGSNTTAIGLNTTHRGSNGSDHSYLDQAVTMASTPTLAGLIIADGGTIGQADGPLITFDDTNNFLGIIGCFVGIGTPLPLSSLHLAHMTNAWITLQKLDDASTTQFRFLDAADNLHWAIFNGADSDDLTFYDNGARLTLQAGGRIGIGPTVTSPLAQLHIDQALTSEAIPVLTLDQADISEGFINFIGSNRGVITETTDSIKSVRVELGGVVYRLALYADA